MAEHCAKHPDTELVEVLIRLCPKCRGSAGGTAAAAKMTAKARRERAIKAVQARERKRREKDSSRLRKGSKR
jgi:Zn-finger nucleic acid-binding protein